MAEQKKKRRVVKKTETVRERAAKASASEATPKGRRLRRSVSTASRPLKAAHRIGKKEYYLPMPDNRAGRFLNKRRRATPGFLANAWTELRQVVWPTPRNTAKLTFAVFAFAIVFGLVIAATDYALDKVFKQLLLS